MMIRDFINDGGRVVTLGGTTMYTGEMLNRSFVSEFIPVDFADGLPIVQADGPMPLRLETQDKLAAPRADVVWYHPSTPRAGTSVLATAGGQAIAVRKDSGAGSFIAFTGTSLGTESETVTPYWKTPIWAALFGEMVRGEKR